jgi:alpha/beta superfamily hydrolase
LRFCLLLFALLGTACTTISPQPGQRVLPESLVRVPAPPAAPTELTVTPHETKIVERSVILKVYDFLRGDDYEAFRVDYGGADGEPARAHLLIPPGPGPHPGVMVFPIRGGSHLVSEALSKSLTNRGYVTLRLERRRVFQHGDPTGDFQVPASRLRDSLSDARRLLDWFTARPEVDGDRIGVAGVSLGGIMAATLLGMDERIRAGFFIMAGGGLPEIIHDSHDPRLETFRDGVQGTGGEVDRESFLEAMRPTTVDLDPLTFAGNVEPDRALIVSARFDRVVPPERTEALWEAMGRPRWIKVPSNHYAILPFFWWSVGQGADLFDSVFAEPSQRQHAAERP